MSHPAELSGHAVWIRLLQARSAKLAFASSLHRATERRGREVGMWVTCGCPGGRQEVTGSPGTPAHLLRSAPRTQQEPWSPHQAHTASSPASSPIKMCYYRTHILPSLNHLPLNEEFLFAKAGNTSPLRHLAQKLRSPAKKGGESENKNF